MPAIVCPQPRSATSSPLSPPFDMAPPLVTLDAAPPRLLSPIRLDSEMDSCNLFNSDSSSPCSSTKRRRSPHEHIYRSSRRQRHCSRVDCHFPTLGVFERMPQWMSRAESVMDVADMDISDVHECSHLGFEDAGHSEPSSAGPIRTRRSRPGSAELDSPRSRDHSSRSPHARSVVPRQDFLSLSPRTPTRRPVLLSEVRFRSLLPVLP